MRSDPAGSIKRGGGASQEGLCSMKLVVDWSIGGSVGQPANHLVCW
jgi:hypothetical protein